MFDNFIFSNKFGFILETVFSYKGIELDCAFTPSLVGHFHNFYIWEPRPGFEPSVLGCWVECSNTALAGPNFASFLKFLYNWVLLENEFDTFKSDSQLIYWNKEINNWTMIKCWAHINEMLLKTLHRLNLEVEKGSKERDFISQNFYK